MKISKLPANAATAGALCIVAHVGLLPLAAASFACGPTRLAWPSTAALAVVTAARAAATASQPFGLLGPPAAVYGRLQRNSYVPYPRPDYSGLYQALKGSGSALGTERQQTPLGGRASRLTDARLELPLPLDYDAVAPAAATAGDRLAADYSYPPEISAVAIGSGRRRSYASPDTVTFEGPENDDVVAMIHSVPLQSELQPPAFLMQYEDGELTPMEPPAAAANDGEPQWIDIGTLYDAPIDDETLVRQSDAVRRWMGRLVENKTPFSNGVAGPDGAATNRGAAGGYNGGHPGGRLTIRGRKTQPPRPAGVDHLQSLPPPPPPPLLLLQQQEQSQQLPPMQRRSDAEQLRDSVADFVDVGAAAAAGGHRNRIDQQQLEMLPASDGSQAAGRNRGSAHVNAASRLPGQLSVGPRSSRQSIGPVASLAPTRNEAPPTEAAVTTASPATTEAGAPTAAPAANSLQHKEDRVPHASRVHGQKEYAMLRPAGAAESARRPLVSELWQRQRQRQQQERELEGSAGDHDVQQQRKRMGHRRGQPVHRVRLEQADPPGGDELTNELDNLKSTR